LTTPEVPVEVKTASSRQEAMSPKETKRIFSVKRESVL